LGVRTTRRELNAPFGSTGYIQRFDVRAPEWVLVIGARRQREEESSRSSTAAQEVA
jgi:hypothetical protein